MKWPLELTCIRHDTSTFNYAKASRRESVLYQKFRQAFEANPAGDETRNLAVAVHNNFRPTSGDWNTPLWNGQSTNGRAVGGYLPGRIALPDVIFVSPYLRTQATLAALVEGWPELGNVKTYEDDRLREQEHGLASLYGDWRVFHTLHPEQRELYALQGSYYYCYPQGENVPDVRLRVGAWLHTLTRDFANKRVLVITHHLTILSIRASLERLNHTEFIRLDHEEKPINCGVTIYRGYPDMGSDGRLLLDKYNLKLYRN